MLAHEQAADHYARALEVLARFDPEAVRRRCDVLLLAGRGPGPQRRASSGLDHLPGGGVAGRQPRGRRQPGPGGDRGLAALHPAARGRRRGADRAARAGAGDDARRASGDAGRAPDPSVRRALLLRPARADEAAERGGDRDRRRARRPAGGGDGGGGAAAGLLGARAPGAAAGRLDPAAAGRQRGRRHGARPPGARLARRRPAGVGRPRRRRRPDRGVHRRRPGASPAAVAWNAAVWRAMRSLLAGHLDQADALASEALSSGIRPEGITAPQYYAVQLLAIRREQLRMAELEPAVRELVVTNPHRPAWRAGLATLLCETDRFEEAAAELDVLAAGGLRRYPARRRLDDRDDAAGRRRQRAGRRGAGAADVRAAAALRSMATW